MTIVDKYASSWRQEIKSQKGSGLKRFRPSSDWQIEEFKGMCDCTNESALPTEGFCHKVFPKKTSGDAATWFPRQITSEKRAQKFHTDDTSLPRSGYCF